MRWLWFVVGSVARFNVVDPLVPDDDSSADATSRRALLDVLPRVSTGTQTEGNWDRTQPDLEQHAINLCHRNRMDLVQQMNLFSWCLEIVNVVVVLGMGPRLFQILPKVTVAYCATTGLSVTAVMGIGYASRLFGLAGGRYGPDGRLRSHRWTQGSGWTAEVRRMDGYGPAVRRWVPQVDGVVRLDGYGLGMDVRVPQMDAGVRMDGRGPAHGRQWSGGWTLGPTGGRRGPTGRHFGPG
ncbi:uncharacterized protein LOC110677206 [Aedes aegypti]|uniref:Uncharacterized protein n=1 Tax=Aedes aegypti TaxID=7159 RepID=A0A6I8U7Z5_AEDAE|nr:uncharacterized protein LOC110677206 [Aedes aegypti]